MKRCRKLTITGKTILDSVSEYTWLEDVFYRYEYKSLDFQIYTMRSNKQDGTYIVIVVHRGMSYMLSDVKLKYVYKEDEAIHVGVEDSETDYIIDCYADKFLNVDTGSICTRVMNGSNDVFWLKKYLANYQMQVY